MPPKLVVVALVAVGMAVAVVVAFVLYANTAEYTECYGIFRSREAAEQAADARDVGLGTYVDHRKNESAVTFDTGETGGDAYEDRQAFREILDSEGGKLGHPGNGCVERTSFN
jgi:hypothetical protein